MADDREYLIRERAHAIWQDEGCPEGEHLAHWLRAEAELGQQSGPVSGSEDQKVKAPRPRASRRRGR